MSYLSTLEARVTELEAQIDFAKKLRRVYRHTPAFGRHYDAVVRARTEDLEAARRAVAEERDAPMLAVGS